MIGRPPRNRCASRDRPGTRIARRPPARGVGACRPAARACIGAAFIAATAAPQAEAGSAFFLRSQSAATLGAAQAGMTAGGTDASAMAFNPAALGFLDGPSAVVAATGINTSSRFSGGRAATVLGSPIAGGDGGDPGAFAVVPNVYLSHPVTPDLTVGLGVASFFGLSSDWNDGWVGRYHALKSELLTINVNPAVSYRVHPRVVAGFGIQIQYADTEVSSALDFGTIDAVAFGGLAGGTPGASDGRLVVKADDWAAGVTLGLLAEPADGLRIGVGYRSAITHRLKGDAAFDTGGPVGATLAAVSGAFVDTGARTRLNLPDIVNVGFRYDATAKLSLLGDAMWLRWSRQKSFRLDFDNPAQPAQETPQDWRDSWFVAFGAEYRPDPAWALRAGAAYDQSPVPDRTRSPVIADADSLWLGVGATWRPKPSLKLDLALGAILGESARVDLRAADPGNAFRGDLSGTAREIRTYFVGLQAAYAF